MGEYGKLHLSKRRTTTLALMIRSQLYDWKLVPKNKMHPYVWYWIVLGKKVRLTRVDTAASHVLMSLWFFYALNPKLIVVIPYSPLCMGTFFFFAPKIDIKVLRVSQLC